MRHITRIGLLLTGALVCGCANDSGMAPGHNTSAANLVTVSPVSGREFRHSRASSRLAIGKVAGEHWDGPIWKTVGEHGVHGTRANGATRGLLNGDAPALLARRFPGTGAEHAKRVTDYFVAAGLPADECAPAQTFSLSTGGGAANVPPKNEVNSVDAYYSRITRVVSGFPVLGSVAWARFNADDVVVSERAYWPAIPASVVQAAERLAKATPAGKGAQIAAQYPSSEVIAAKVVILHTPAYWDGAFEARASYDVSFRSRDMSVTRHFDEGGVEFVLAHEKLAASIPGEKEPEQ